MRRLLAPLVFAGVPAMLLSACNGSGAGSGIAAIPSGAATSAHHSRLHHNDNGPQDLHAGGADIPAYAYNLGNQPVGYYNNPQAPPGEGSLLYAAPTQGTVYYCLTSSTDGRHAFEGYEDSGYPPTGPCAALGDAATGFGGRQDPLDFVGTAVALASTECCGSSTPYAQNRLQGTVTWGQPFEFPQIGGNIVYGYRPQDFKANVSEIKLSTWSYCAIANGTVSDWNDPAITADNGKSVTGGASETITFYFRQDSAGTTNNFTNHLNTVCNQTWGAPYNQYPYQGSARSAAWTFGVSSTWPGPGSSGDPNQNFVGENGDPGILAGVQSTKYSTGYVAGAYVKAANPKVSQAYLQNGMKGKNPIFINPTNSATLAKAFAKVTAANITYGGGSDGNPLGSSTPWCQLYIPNSYYVNPPKGSYPIVDVSYLLFYGQNNGVHVPDKTALIKFLVSAQANTIIKKLEYAPLSSSVESAVVSALNGNGSQAACLQ
ncbi:MAG: substrate-binding domain-containing protein [Candidatus Eremiobacteraeota bacterium]|nr:substrate-binding domain-containing protein [Candidatus Eremiobacteraeota bacterium]